MENLKQLQKQEAIERLKILHDQYDLMETVINEFEKKDTVYYSEHHRKVGILYWASNEEKYVRLMKKFEEEHNALVYHAILSSTTFGKLFTMLYVSKNMDEWKTDQEELSEGIPFVYVKNLDDDSCSEFGCIQIVSANGGITRLA